MDPAIFVYNFSDAPVSGVISVEHAPQGWNISPRQVEVSLEPMERKRLPIRLSVQTGGEDVSTDGWIKLRGEFSNAGHAVLAFRLTPK